MDEACAGLPVRIDLAYAQDDNLLFGERIYRSNARLFLHDALAQVVRDAAIACHDLTGHWFVLHDGLRTVEAQEKMLRTQKVRQNPHWLEPPRLLSAPGQGGHPRGMAIDISLQTETGEILDMGTAFDFLAENASPLHNPAHRDYAGLKPLHRKNRNILTWAMVQAAARLNIPLLPLPQEWWDFRLSPDMYECYAPLSETDLPPAMRLLDSN